MFQLPQLPYPENALEPIISSQTIQFHYGKHHRAYLDNLNKLLVGSTFENATLEEIIKTAEGGIFNNGAQVWNHTFYWHCLTPVFKDPKGELLGAIQRDFGSLDLFQQEFSRLALTLFGSGWVWLVSDSNGKLSIKQESNAGNPLRNGLNPILTCDVWEHAYYLDQQNRRAEYVEGFWKIVNWEFAEQNFLK
jgi:superoxide dismutase, Fe-Mn family